MSEIPGLAIRVDHQKKFIVTQSGNHQVVNDAPGLIREQRITLLPDCQCLQINRHQGFQLLCRTFATDHDLTHMRNIKKSGFGTSVQMLFHDAKGV